MLDFEENASAMNHQKKHIIFQNYFSSFYILYLKEWLLSLTMRWNVVLHGKWGFHALIQLLETFSRSSIFSTLSNSKPHIGLDESLSPEPSGSYVAVQTAEIWS